MQRSSLFAALAILAGLLLLVTLWAAGVSVRAAAPQLAVTGAGSPGLGALRAAVPLTTPTILYDQYDHIGTRVTSSQYFTDTNATLRDQAADDFVVPAGQSWTLTEVDVQGAYFNGPGPATSVNVALYQDAAALPGPLVFTQTNLAYAPGPISGAFVITVPATTLLAGTYWLAVQATLGSGQWGWTDRTLTSNNPAAWQNPGNGFATGCTTWGVRATCFGIGGEPDQVFRLLGTATILPPPTPTVTVTGTPPTATATPPPAATRTPGPPFSPTPTVTGTPPTATPTPSPGPPTATGTPCLITFSDVHATDYFYTPVLYLACHGVISGYSDGTFRPYNNTTRSQMVKIVVLGFAIPIVTPSGGNYTFADVLPSNPFFAVIETAAAGSIVSGYGCGGPNEPCDSANRPYFRPYANVTRGQLAKIVVVAAGWRLISPATATFADVAPGSAFYTFVQTAFCHGIISGYACGGPGEPCNSTNQPYFRPFNNATRGQIAKIVYIALTSGQPCVPLADR
ncbi:MAG TPA: S-layer homology domain-containing protein [Chloroflexia bacterium]|nr:S-layer homology domain-containing protein [Chloroflexia bacterium]